ncbi:MAG: L-seryl-tRNA(Sec) selenium transferase [Caldilineaceae bacterium]
MTRNRHSPSDHIAQQASLRALPSVDALLKLDELQPLRHSEGYQAVADAVRQALDETRLRIRSGHADAVPHDWGRRVQEILQAVDAASLRAVINATGVIIHTNLGRAPLSDAARQAVAELGRGYTNLEYDLAEGHRGSRYDHARTLLCELTGAEDALVVNNNAAAVYLVLAALCQSREVVISRGQLVEIGGGFRIPDVLRQSGARLVEVGTTNRTHARDFAAAIGEETAALMRVHASNFKQMGFVTQPALADLVAIAADSPVRPLVIDDLGSGTLLDTAAYGLSPEPTVQDSVAAGADLVTFSGDKLLGGPQAGLIIGKRQPLAILRKHPMARALRVDKMTLAALDATLRSYRRGHAEEEIPVWRMISAPSAALQQRAQAWRQKLHAVGLPAVVIAGESTVGGGSLPGETLPTWLLALDLARPDDAAAFLRRADTPVIVRIQQDQLLLDPRTVDPADDDTLLNILLTLKDGT